MYTPSKSGIRRSQGQPLSSDGLAKLKEHAEHQYQRALEQIKLKAWDQALKELREAIQIVPDNGEYHALLAEIYLHNGMMGMANISVRQALKLDPANSRALQCQKRLVMKSTPEKPKSTGLLSHLFGQPKTQAR
ncbi:MAG: hypothetical protein SFW36_04260 [Leptolyngbyaceae cyanobacterium bins.59]|nr:hypothetical protein [Leptolyngbyaceae cyanobacterium bins.59]